MDDSTGWGHALAGQLDVDEGGHGLHGAGVLGVVEEVAHARLVLDVPLEDVELASTKGCEEGTALTSDDGGGARAAAPRRDGVERDEERRVVAAGGW